MSNTTIPLPPQTRLKTAITAPKRPQKDPTTNENATNDTQTRDQAISYLTSKDYLTHGNPITLPVLAHALSQLGSAASKMPKALTDGIAAIVVLINDHAAQKVVNDIANAVTAQLQDHMEAFASNVEKMRDAVDSEHVTVAAKNITGKLNDFNDGFQESAEHLVQATQELTEKTSEKSATHNNPAGGGRGLGHYLKTYASTAKQHVPPAHEAIIARGEQTAKQIKGTQVL
jgi:predicted Zn-dependent protease with MMP-like domain